MRAYLTRMTRKPKTTAFWVGRLPHWEVEEGRYFITIHLAGAIPAAGRERLRTLAEQLPRVADKQSSEWLALQRRIFGEMEEWLDRAEWDPKLKDPAIASMVSKRWNIVSAGVIGICANMW